MIENLHSLLKFKNSGIQ